MPRLATVILARAGALGDAGDEVTVDALTARRLCRDGKARPAPASPPQAAQEAAEDEPGPDHPSDPSDEAQEATDDPWPGVPTYAEAIAADTGDDAA